ncbi:MAG: TOMM precursor leader peptide-binding protein [Betaproteobacteria bacterium]
MPLRNPHASVHILSGDLVLVIDEDGARPISGRLGPLILPLVDGCRSVLDISDALEGQATIADVDVGVTELVEEGVLLTSEAARASDSAEPFAASEPDKAPPRATASLVAIGGVSRAAVELFAAGMRRAGVAVDAAMAAAPRVILVDDYLSDELDAVNRESLRAGTSWLLVKPLGFVPWVGPMFDPARATPCWRCLAARLKETSPIEDYLRRHYPAVRAPRYVPPAVPAAIERAAAAAAEWCLRPLDDRTASMIETIDTRTGSIRWHPVAARPHCPACRAANQSPSRVESLPPTDADPGALPARFARHVSPVTGIVAHVSSSSYGPAHVATADHVFPPEIELPDSLWRACRRRTAASGTTAVDARVSAVAEALERYSGVYRESDAGRRATYQSLGGSAIHPNDVMGFSAAQFAGRRRWNLRQQSRAARVAEPFDEDEPRSWTPVTKLGCDDRRWLPTALCYFGARPERERRGCISDSNGCAAGETFDAAVVRGFLELVERDAVGIWWYNRLARPGVDLLTVPDAFVRSLVEHHRQIDRTLVVLDVTTDLGVPVFAALSSEPSGDRLTIGFGADFQPLRALRHALLELSLFLPELAAGRRRALVSGPVPSGSYLEPVGTRPWSTWVDTRAGEGSGPAQTPLARVHALASAHHLDVFVLDQTRPDVGVPVARVIVPGLRHFWPRFAPGRLFSVPVRMGWRERPTEEYDLNPSVILI